MKKNEQTQFVQTNSLPFFHYLLFLQKMQIKTTCCQEIEFIPKDIGIMTNPQEQIKPFFGPQNHEMIQRGQLMKPHPSSKQSHPPP